MMGEKKKRGGGEESRVGGRDVKFFVCLFKFYFIFFCHPVHYDLVFVVVV